MPANPRVHRARAVLIDLTELPAEDAGLIAVRVAELQIRAHLSIEEINEMFDRQTVDATKRARSIERRKQNAAAFREQMLPVVRRLRASGITGLGTIAAVLNAEGYRPRFAARWTSSLVYHLVRADPMTPIPDHEEGDSHDAGQ